MHQNIENVVLSYLDVCEFRQHVNVVETTSSHLQLSTHLQSSHRPKSINNLQVIIIIINESYVFQILCHQTKINKHLIINMSLLAKYLIGSTLAVAVFGLQSTPKPFVINLLLDDSNFQIF